MSVLRSLLVWLKRVAAKVAAVQARILLMLTYFLIVWPFALAVGWLRDPLAIKPATVRGWRPIPEQQQAPLDRAQNQF